MQSFDTSNYAEVRRLRSQLETELPEEPAPPFTFRVGWSPTYDALFAGSFATTSGVVEILGRAFQTGRILLSARGGGGKTVVLNRLARIALTQSGFRKMLPIRVDLRRFDQKAWNECGNSVSRRMDMLLGLSASPSVSESALDLLPAEMDRLLLVDGLNEVPYSTGQEVLDTMDAYLSYAVRTGFIIADRLVRRELRDPTRWLLATVLPLDSKEIDSAIRKWFSGQRKRQRDSVPNKKLLASPYFLDGYLKNEIISMRTYFLDHASLTPSQLMKAATAAFTVYKKEGSRTFSERVFTQRAGSIVKNKLKHAGALITSDGRTWFDHHLKHDYLASLYLSAKPTRWSWSAFDAVTFHTSSFESLSFALESIGSSEDADRFVRAVYDWNLYGAAYAVADARARGSLRVTNEMEVILLAMLAERKWDIITATATRATDALSVFPRQDAQRLLKAKSLKTIMTVVNQVTSDRNWFVRWRSLFGRSTTVGITNSELQLISDKDSLTGWTMANVLKRTAITKSQQKELRRLSRNRKGTVRWRVVHVLGAFPNRDNSRVLFGRLESDSYYWVRYGATRSLVEMAARAKVKALRRAIFAGLSKRVPMLLCDPKSLSEFERAIFIRAKKAPLDWLPLVTRVVERLWKTEDSFERREHWIRVLNRLRDHLSWLPKQGNHRMFASTGNSRATTDR